MEMMRELCRSWVEILISIGLLKYLGVYGPGLLSLHVIYDTLNIA
jgi:hypothetical protein